MTELQIQKIKTVLKEQLKKNKITYEALADDLEVSLPTIKRWMGEAEIGLTDLLRICTVLNLNLADLQALTEKIGGANSSNNLTDEQQAFFAKNIHYFAYFLKIVEGITPEQIAEKYKLTKLTTDKYLVKLEQLGLIKVTGKLKVKPIMVGSPNLGHGALAKAFYKQFVRASGEFFIEAISEDIRMESMATAGGEKYKSETKFGLQIVTLTRESFTKWATENGKVLRQLEAISRIESKAFEKKDLMTAVILDAHCLQAQDHKRLELLDTSLIGGIINL